MIKSKNTISFLNKSSLYTSFFIGGTGRRSTYSFISTENLWAAYSLRRLVEPSVYDGPCIKVRRTSDGELFDVGFSGNDLDTEALLAFAGSGTCVLDTWYDQSGRGMHLLQSAGAGDSNPNNTPRIVVSGVLVTTESSRPSTISHPSNSRIMVAIDSVDTSANLTSHYLVAGTGSQQGSVARYWIQARNSTSGGNRRSAVGQSSANARAVLERGNNNSDFAAPGPVLPYQDNVAQWSHISNAEASFSRLFTGGSQIIDWSVSTEFTVNRIWFPGNSPPPNARVSEALWYLDVAHDDETKFNIELAQRAYWKVS